MLILSLFPGIDLLGRAFEEVGFYVVRGPDILWGQDIRDFHAPSGKFDGVIGGSRCQDFSSARRSAPTGEGVELMQEFARVVTEAQPAWFLLENVERAPDLHIEGYFVQRLTINALECGSRQNRNRKFQFGSKTGIIITPQRQTKPPKSERLPAAMATDGLRSNRPGWPEFCQRQGLPADFDLPGWSTAAKYRAVGNGVPLPMGRTMARAILQAVTLRSDTAIEESRSSVTFCPCGCGRVLVGNQQRGGPACRKRIQRSKNRAAVQ